jgi:hypothetical protein
VEQVLNHLALAVEVVLEVLVFLQILEVDLAV